MNPLLAQAAGLFTAPVLAGVGAAAVSIPIIIHLMSRFRRKPEAWGAMRFLIEAYRKQRKRLQIEKLLLLLVRCMVVMLAGLALAGPILGGCKRGQMVFGGGGGRVVYIVIDDALSSQTREAGATRLDQHKQQALKVIDEMGSEDRAVIVRMGRPVQMVLDDPTSDTDALREAVQNVSPRFSRGELVDALALVQQSMDREALIDGEAVVVLLSDFPGSSQYFDQALPPEVEGLGRRATIVTAQPPEGTTNLQIMSLEPRRRMVVVEAGGSASVGGRVVLRRFGAVSQPQDVGLRVWIEDSAGKALASTQRKVRWPAGQPEVGANYDLSVDLPEGQVIGGGRELVVRAKLLPATEEAGLDVLPADDQAWAVVRLRSRLQVALIDDEQDLNPNAGEFEARQLVRAALTPSGPGQPGSFELSPLLPTSVRGENLEPYDALIVLRPDQVRARGWEALAEFSRQGGLVWVFPPALEAEPDWAETLKQAFGLPWAFGEALVRYEPAEGSDKDGAALDQTTAPPSQLQDMAAGWREDLGWVKVYLWLPVSVGAEGQWIRFDATDPALPARDKPVLMAYRPVGRGTLLFTATPLDTRFTNLPFRGVFVPLMQDSLRGVLGSTTGEAAQTAGDRPLLGQSWLGVGELAVPATEGDDDENQTVLARTEGDGVRLDDAVDRPGIYTGAVSGTPRLLAVNPDPAGGDTLGGQQPLELMLDALGEWSYLKDREQAGGILAQSDLGTNLTRTLLWVLLGFILLETFLARRFSHATDNDKPTIVGRVLGALHGSEADAKTTAGGGA